MMWCIRPRWNNACAAHSEQTRPGEGLQGTTATGGEGCQATMERLTSVGKDVSLHGLDVTAPPEAPAGACLFHTSRRGDRVWVA